MHAEILTPEADGIHVTQELVPVKTYTEKQIAASRRNGSHSRGPVTQEGKSRSRLSALKHGLFSRLIPIFQQPGLLGRRDFDEIVTELKEDLKPWTQLQVITIEELALEIFKLQCIHLMELSIFKAAYDNSYPIEIWTPERVKQSADNMTSDELRREIELLAELGRGFATSQTPELASDFVSRTALVFWNNLAPYKYRIMTQQNELMRIDVQASAAVTEKEKKLWARERKKGAKYLAELVEQEKESGPSACGVNSVDEVAMVLRGERSLPEDQVAAWQILVNRRTDYIRSKLQIYSQNEQAMATVRQESAARMLELMPRLNLSGQYATMIQRNIMRFMKSLEDQGLDLRGCSGSFLEN